MPTFFYNFNKFIKNPWKGYRYVRNSLVGSSYRDHVEYIKKQNIVWNPCTPKSASTFWGKFCVTVFSKQKLKSNFFDMEKAVAPEFDNRPQIACSHNIRSEIAPFQELCISSHGHIIATDDVLGMMSDKHTIVCLMRPVLDTIASLIDQFDRGIPLFQEARVHGHSVNFWSPLLHMYWDRLSLQEKIDELVQHYLPWHLKFLQTWILASDHYDVKFISFDDIVGNTQKCFNEVYSRWGVTLEEKDIPTIDAIRFNKGISGRGKSVIPEKTIERIVNIVKKTDKLKQSLDDYI